MKSQHLALILTVTAVIVFGAAALVLVSDKPVTPEPANYTYNVVNVYPHDKTAFTQGLIFEGRGPV